MDPKTVTDDDQDCIKVTFASIYNGTSTPTVYVHEWGCELTIPLVAHEDVFRIQWSVQRNCHVLKAQNQGLAAVYKLTLKNLAYF